MYKMKIWFVPKIIMDLMYLYRKVDIIRIVMEVHVKKDNDYSYTLKHDLNSLIHYAKDILKQIN